MSHPCSIGGCERRVRYDGTLCTMHKKRAKRGGNVAEPGVVKVAAYDQPCLVDGCNRRAEVRAMCRTHCARWRRNGSPEIVTVAADGSASDHGNGYRTVTRHGHPLAAKNGHVYEHRLALFDAIGAGRHSCHWCGTVVSWDERTPGHPLTLVVDHLNAKRDDNRPENLVPSCWSCNCTRSNRKAIADVC